MIEVSKLRKLGVGDIVEFQRYKKEERKKELIATIKDLYGDNIPADMLGYVEQQLKLVPKLEDGVSLTFEEMQYMVWMSLRKSDPDATLKQVGEQLETDNLDKYISAILPQADTIPVKKKPPPRKPKHKDN
jgi:hypothetical protein